MRKFVIKNRQKRKYTKKSEAISSFSFSKTAFGMVPILIMIIAFMSTIIISAPLRDDLSNITFTFALPQFSLSNPLHFIQTVTQDATQIGSVFWTISALLVSTIYQSLLLLITKIIVGIDFFVSSIQYLGSSLTAAGNFTLELALHALTAIQQTLLLIGLQLGMMFQTIYSFTSTLVVIASQYVVSVTITTWHAVVFTFSVVVTQVLAATLFIAHGVMYVAETIWTAIYFVLSAIGTAIMHAVTAVAHVIELPFKILYAFWLRIKPYVDIFASHVVMTGKDFNNGLTDWGKVAQLMDPAK